MAESNNLWPQFQTGQIVTPKALMTEQAQFLTEMTKKLIIASVATVKMDKDLDQDFKLFVPGLDNYTYLLFYVKHDPVILYPASGHYNGSVTKLDTQEILIEFMKKIFNSAQTKNIVQSILAQVQSEEK